MTDTDDQLEQAVLGAYIWARPAARNVATRAIHPRHFQHGRNRTLWEHASALHRNNEPITIAALVDSLDNRNHLDDAGGINHIHAIAEHAPIGGTLETLTERLTTRARHRETIAATADLLTQLRGADPNDLDTITANGAAEIVRAGRAQRGPNHDPAHLETELDRLWTQGADQGWDSGWPNLDTLYRPTAGQLTVITGIPAAGKTTWLNAYLARLAHRHNHRYAIFSPEQSSPAKHVRNLTITHGGANPSPDVRRQAQQWILDHFAFVDHRDTRNLPELTAAFRVIHDTQPVHGVVIDPWNWLEATRPTWMTETEFVGYALNDIIRLAQDLGVHAWVVAHPRKVDKRADGTYQLAGPYDIAGSANWFNKPWFVLTLWRDHLADGSDPDHDPHVLEVHVMKARDDDQGRIGKAELRMQLGTRRYAPLADARRPL